MLPIGREYWDSTDKAHRMLALILSPLERDRIKDGLSVDADCYAKLKKLEGLPTLHEAVSALRDCTKDVISVMEVYRREAADHMDYDTYNTVNEADDIIRENHEETHKLICKVLATFDRAFLEKLLRRPTDPLNRLASAETLLKEFAAKRFSPHVIKARKIFDEITVSAANLLPEFKREHWLKAENIFSRYEKIDDTIFQYAKAKIARSRELAQVDRTVGHLYALYTASLVAMLDMPYDRLVETVEKRTIIMRTTQEATVDLVVNDDQRYSAILASVIRQAKDAPPISKTQRQEEELTLNSVLQQIQGKREEKYAERARMLKQAILRGRAGALHPDSEKRVDYFVDDILAKGCTDINFQNLCDSFKGLNLGYKTRSRSARPRTEEELTAFRTFFDDVYSACAKGAIPGVKELQRIYQKTLQEKG